MADGLASIGDKIVPSNVTVGVGLPGEGYAALGTAALRLIADLQEECNSPDMVKADIARKKLAAIDDLVTAQRNNDIETEREDVETVNP